MTIGPATVTRAKDGRGGLFAVDWRAWHFVTELRLLKRTAH